MPSKRKVIAVACFLGFLFCGTALPAEDIAVTGAIVRNGLAAGTEIVINNGLKISGIGVSRSGTAVSIVFPRHISRKGHVFPQVQLLTSQAQAAVRRAIITGKTDGHAALVAPLRYALGSCKVFKRSSSLKGVAHVRFNAAVDVECMIVEGKNGCWVVWPQGKKRARLVTVLDKRLRESIEQDILCRFEEMKSEGTAEDE